MAGMAFSAVTDTAPTLTSSTAKTVLQILAAANRRVIVTGVVVSFDGVTAADAPIRVDLVLQSDVGSGSSAVTPTKLEQSISESLQSTAVRNCTSEPTGSTIYHSEYVHEQGGVPLAIVPGSIIIKAGDRLGIRATPGTLTGTVKCCATFYGTE